MYNQTIIHLFLATTTTTTTTTNIYTIVLLSLSLFDLVALSSLATNRERELGLDRREVRK